MIQSTYKKALAFMSTWQYSASAAKSSVAPHAPRNASASSSCDGNGAWPNANSCATTTCATASPGCRLAQALGQGRRSLACPLTVEQQQRLRRGRRHVALRGVRNMVRRVKGVHYIVPDCYASLFGKPTGGFDSAATTPSPPVCKSSSPETASNPSRTCSALNREIGARANQVLVGSVRSDCALTDACRYVALVTISRCIFFDTPAVGDESRREPIEAIPDESAALRACQSRWH